MQEEGGECSSFQQGAFFLEFCFVRSTPLPGDKLSQEQNKTLQNLWVGESLEILEMHYIYLIKQVSWLQLI